MRLYTYKNCKEFENNLHYIGFCVEVTEENVLSYIGKRNRGKFMHEFKNMDFMESAFNSGCFVTADDNPMVCSWGFVGVMWGKKIFIAPIRECRHTYGLLEKTREFTVSVPEAGTFKKELGFCGSKSGRDYDKWAETGMEKQPAKSVGTCVALIFYLFVQCFLVLSHMSGQRRQWHPTPVLLPGKSHGRRSLVGCSPWGR